MADAPVLRERLDDGIEVLRLNRPDKRNALDTASLQLLNAALDELAVDETMTVLVLSTTSTQALCAGADVGERLDEAGGVARMAAFTRLYSGLDAFPVPVVAVCVGNCVGAGAEIVAGADLRVGGDNLAGLGRRAPRRPGGAGPAARPSSGWPGRRTSSSPAARRRRRGARLGLLQRAAGRRGRGGRPRARPRAAAPVRTRRAGAQADVPRPRPHAANASGTRTSSCCASSSTAPEVPAPADVSWPRCDATRGR